jgi:hypothetical protein
MNRCFVSLLTILLLTAQISYADDENTSQASDISNENVIEKAPSTDEPTPDDIPEENTAFEKDPQPKSDVLVDVPLDSVATQEPFNDNKTTQSIDPINAPENDSQETTITENTQISEKEPTHSDDADDLIEQIRVNEILANPDGTDSGNEFIELYNAGNKPLDISGWHVCDLSTYDQDKESCDLSKSSTYLFPDETTIDSHAYHTIYNKKDFSFAINNTNEKIYLTNSDNDPIFQFFFTTSASGLSWNYYEDQWYEEIPTPSAINNENPLTKEYPTILINEILPYPDGEEEFIELYNPLDVDVSLDKWIIKDASASGKYIFENTVIPAHDFLVIYREIFSFALNNYGDETVSLVAPNSTISSSISYNNAQKNRSLNADKTWYWADPTPGKANTENPLTKEYPILHLSEILPNPTGSENTDEYIEIHNPHNDTIDLNGWTIADDSVSGRYVFPKDAKILAHAYITIHRSLFKFALNNTKESVHLIAPNTKTMSTVYYESCREGISFNFDIHTNTWRWSKHLTPGEENIFNNLPIIIHYDVDNSAYKNVYAEFSITAHDTDNEKLKVRWDFGDGRRSYLWKTRHKYTENGVYHGSVRIQDDSEEVVRRFTVSVKNYPKHKIIITRIMPNPAGKDTGNEYIVIKNKSNKRIDLKNWSIATGSHKKTLVNHPIYDQIFIRPGKEKLISRRHSAISLPNKTGVIEIRRPNGTVSDTRSYDNDGNNIPDNALYEKIDDQWQWTIHIDPETQQKIHALLIQAIFNEKTIAQQLIEREIAFQAIYTPSKKDVAHTINTAEKTIDRILAHKINAIINEMLLSLQDKYALKTTHAKHFGDPYIIPHDDTPCTPSYMHLEHTLSLCK